MFIVLLKFSANRKQAAAHLEAHKHWLRGGHADGVFLLSGSLVPGLGGAILAQAPTRASLETRIAADPFVIADVVHAEILEVAPGIVDPALAAVFAQQTAAQVPA